MAKQSRTSSATDALTDEYAEWNRQQGLNLGSADEHLFDTALTEDQRTWLHGFVERWEEAEKFDRGAPAIWIEGPFGHAYYWRDSALWAAPMHRSGRAAPFDLQDGVQTLVEDFAEPLTAEQRAAVVAGLQVAELMPGRRVSIIDCADYSWEPEQDKCAAWLIIVEAPDGTAIFDPYASECGRLTVDPLESFGIPPEAARLIQEHNKVRL